MRRGQTIKFVRENIKEVNNLRPKNLALKEALLRAFAFRDEQTKNARQN